MKDNKGITLIALVVTIIVLLILAGVSIAMLTGQTGILQNADKASYETKLANDAERISYYVAEEIANAYAAVAGTGSTTAVNIQTAIRAGIEKVLPDNTSTGVTGTYTASSITLTCDGHHKSATINPTSGGIKWGPVEDGIS